jgi:O-antigen/teichoic acid export membrane protein
VTHARVVWNSLAGTLLLLTNIAVSFIMAPFLVRQLGADGYGLWELMLGLVGYMGVLDFGISPAIVRYIALAHGAGDKQAMLRTYEAGRAFLYGVGVVGLTVFGLISLRPALIFGAGAAPVVGLSAAVVMFGLNFMANFARASFTCFLFGMQLHRVVNTVRILMAIGSSVAIYHWLSHPGGRPLFVLATLTCVATTIEAVIFGIYAHVVEPSLRAARKPQWKLILELGRFGTKSAAQLGATALLKNGLLFVISHVIGVGTIVFYVFPLRLVEYAQGLAMTLGIPMTPFFASAFGRGGLDAARASWIGSTRVLQFPSFAVAMGVLWLGVPFIARWMGADTAAHGGVTLYLLGAGLLTQAYATNALRLLTSLGRHGRYGIVCVIASALFVLASVPLARSYGLTGVAAAAAAYMGVASVTEILLACKAMEIGFWAHVRDTTRHYGVPALAASLVYWLLRQSVPATTYVEILVHGALGTLAFTIVAVGTALSSQERREIFQRLSRAPNGGRPPLKS